LIEGDVNRGGQGRGYVVKEDIDLEVFSLLEKLHALEELNDVTPTGQGR